MMQYIQLLRPKQWIKNVFVLAGIIFSRQFYHPESVLKSLAGFVIFSLLSSSVYIINDILDYQEDKFHPVKSQRPLAAGTITKTTAWLLAIMLFVATIAGAYFLSREFMYACVVYVIVMVLYSVAVKHIIILDVLFVSFGYVLRAIAGALVIDVSISSWLLLCTLLIALFLAISKRRAEIVILGTDAAKHRKTLSEYNVDMLNMMIAIVTSACIVSYCLYTLSQETVVKFGTRNLIVTVPCVIYGIFRYLHLIHKQTDTGTPEQILITDRPLQICLLLWVCLCIVILIQAG